MAQKYAKGTRAWGICGRGGHRVLLKDMVFDGRYPNMRVDPAWFEDKHPQEFLPKVEDPIALYRPAVEVITGPTAPVLAVILTGTQASLTWSPSETDITEIDSYTIMRSVDGAPAVVLIVCAVLRDFLGGIIGVQNCTTVPSIPSDDSGDSGSVYDKVTNEDAPVTYVDTTLSSGHTYCYTVFSTPMGNNQSVAQGPPSAPSNTVCVSTSAGTGLIWTFRANFGVEVQALATHAGLTLAIDAAAVVHESTDGGRTWANLSTIPGLFGAGGNLIFNNGVWIYGAGGLVARSTDNGATWTVVDSGATSAGQSVLAGNGANLLILSTNTVNPAFPQINYARSTDNGLTWTAVDALSGKTLYLNPPIWDGTEFVGLSAGRVVTSTDGITWTLQPVGNLVQPGVQFSGGDYIVGSFTDVDAIIFSATPAGLGTVPPVPVSTDSSGLVAVLASPGLYFALDQLGGVTNSSDGATWVPGILNMPVGETADSQAAVVYDSVNAAYIAGGSNGSICTYAPTVRAAFFSQTAHGAPGYLATGIFPNGGVGASTVRLSSTRFGLSTAANIPVPGLDPNGLQSSYYLANRYMVGDAAGGIATSGDGITWALATNTAATLLQSGAGAVYDDTHNTIIAALNTNMVLVATPGAGPLAFTQVALPVGVIFNSIAYQPGSGVALGIVGSGGSQSNVYRSTDGGATWTQVATHIFPSNSSGEAIFWTGSQWMAFGSADLGGTSMSVSFSTDNGATWSAPAALATLQDLSFSIGTDGGLHWIIVGQGAGPLNILTSSNGGVTWTAPSSFSAQGGFGSFGVIWDGAQWSASFTDVTQTFEFPATSPDGITWTAGPTVVD